MEIDRKGEIKMAKVTLSKLEKDDPIFMERFETYNPRSKTFFKGWRKELDPKKSSSIFY